MTASFRDGPAGGRASLLRRLPVLLRVVVGPCGEIDALDQLDDVPELLETIYVYRKYRGLFDYRLNDVQPPDAILRHNDRWQEWANSQPR